MPPEREGIPDRTMLRRCLALLCAMLLLGSLSAALAANAGSAADPLLSQSYADSWAQRFLQAQEELLRQRLLGVGTDRQRELWMLSVSSGEKAVRLETLPAGATVALREGDSFTLLTGAANVQVQSGTLVDVTHGREVYSGSLTAGNQYICCEVLSAVLTVTQESLFRFSGGPAISKFGDSSAAAWYGSAVDYASLRGLMSGTGATTFEPSRTVTRAMFVTILGRMAGVDAGQYPGVSFRDVEAGSWYAPYVEWGVKKGIVTGMGDGSFAPSSSVTREQMAALIARYASAYGIELPSAASGPRAFADAASISGWAADSVELMRRTGLITGDEYSRFHPQNGATRAEAATVFRRLDATLQIL